MEETNALRGFNLTDQLLQQLFSEIDPHKKGFLTETDWMLAFGGFDWHEQLIVELQNLIACSFADIESAFDYYQVIDTNKVIDKTCFVNASNSLRGTNLKDEEARYLWKYFSEGHKSISYDMFVKAFSSISFSGKATLRKRGKSLGSTILVSHTASSSTWTKDVMEKFRKIIKSSNMHLREIFESFDEDGNGLITPIEFRNAVRKLQINLTAKEIDEIIRIVDRNMDGMIDWVEFSSKFKTKENERLIETRARNKMAKLKEQMTLHMKSPQDAFMLFDKQKTDKLSFANFNDLIKMLSALSKQQVPPFSIIKDMFDEIDINKDGEIDLKEWNQTFIVVQEGDNKFILKKVPLHLAEFEISRDAKTIHEAIVRNRKFLMQKFAEVSEDGTHVSFENAKEVVRAVQRGKVITDEEYKVLFKGALKEHDMVEFKKLGKSLKTKFA